MHTVLKPYFKTQVITTQNSYYYLMAKYIKYNKNV